MPVRPQLSPEQNAQPIADFKAAVQEFSDAAQRLTLAWEKLDQGGNHAPTEALKNYPFEQSFDELYHALIEWAHDVENAPDETFGGGWLKDRDIDADMERAGRKPANASVQAALKSVELFKHRVARRIKQAALAVVAEYERKKAVALTNEGYGTQSKCYKCQQIIGEGELSTWEGGMECHAGRCPDAPKQQMSPSQRTQNLPQRGAPKSEEQLGLQRKSPSGYAPMASKK
jgi:hypothetical protein